MERRALLRGSHGGAFVVLRLHGRHCHCPCGGTWLPGYYKGRVECIGELTHPRINLCNCCYLFIYLLLFERNCSRFHFCCVLHWLEHFLLHDSCVSCGPLLNPPNIVYIYIYTYMLLKWNPFVICVLSWLNSQELPENVLELLRKCLTFHPSKRWVHTPFTFLCQRKILAAVTWERISHVNDTQNKQNRIFKNTLITSCFVERNTQCACCCCVWCGSLKADPCRAAAWPCFRWRLLPLCAFPEAREPLLLFPALCSSGAPRRH